MNLRRLRRLAALAWFLSLAMVRLAVLVLRGHVTAIDRALWLQSACRDALRSIGLRYSVKGVPPSQGLVVSNHLSYLDIAVFSAAMPCVFIAKAEVNKWPYFGLAARAGGTVFLDRSSRISAANAASEISTRLRSRIPVLLFPEGTSTDGSTVIRFHSTLFQSAIDSGLPITPAAIRYESARVPEAELCWFGEIGFLSHLWKVLGLPASSASLEFGESLVCSDRRSAALATHESVAAMRAGMPAQRELSAVAIS